MISSGTDDANFDAVFGIPLLVAMNEHGDEERREDGNLRRRIRRKRTRCLVY